MGQRCVWCNKDGGDLREIAAPEASRLVARRGPRAFLVHPEHERAFEAFHRRARKLGWLFLALIAASVLSLIAFEAVVLGGNRAAGVAGIGGTVLFLGGVMLALPFSTPETVALFGAQAASRLVRILGIGIAGLGAYVLTLA